MPLTEVKLPHIRREDKLPFIPAEDELDALIWNACTRMAAFLRLYFIEVYTFTEEKNSSPKIVADEIKREIPEL